MRTRIIYPEPELRDLVQYFWVLEVPLIAGEQSEIRTFVDDSSGIIFHDYEGESALLKNGKHLPMGLIYGQARLPSLTTVVHPFSAVGILFHPHGIRTLFGIDAYYLTDRTYSIDEFDKESDLRDIMLNAKSPEEKIKIFSDFLLRKKRFVREIDTIVLGSIEMIKTLQVASVKDLLLYFRISERQLERRFLSSVGVSPRHYLQISRFKLLIQSMHHQDFKKLSELAGELSFADQAHFNRVVRRFSGLTPKSFQSHLKSDIINLLFR